jgi:hypothetical protein
MKCPSRHCLGSVSQRYSYKCHCSNTHLHVVGDIGRISGPVVDVCSPRPTYQRRSPPLRRRDLLLIISPHRIPSTTIVIELLSETSNTISLIPTKVNSTSRVPVDTSITSDLPNLTQLILRSQLTCSFDMERCYVLVAAAWVCCTDWVGSVPCVAIWGWEGIGAFDDIDFTTFRPAVLDYSPPCGPLFISCTLAASGRTHSTASDWHMVDIQNIYSLAIS